MSRYLEIFQKSKTVTTVLLVMLFLVLNWVSYSFYVRFDLSERGLLRLTAASKKIIRELPEIVTLEAFFSEDVPEEQIADIKSLRDFLDEYKNASRGKVKLIFLDPSEDEDAKKRAQKEGITAARSRTGDDTKMAIQDIYLSVLISYEDKKDVIKDVTKLGLNVGAWEYDLTSRIFKMAFPDARSVGFLSNHGQFTLEEQTNPFITLAPLSKAIERNYGPLKAVDTGAEDIDGSIGTLIITTPDSLSDMDKFRIDQFVMRGGNLILAIAGMSLSFQQWLGQPISDDVINFFKTYGLAFGKDMIYETENFLPFVIPTERGIVRSAYLPFVVLMEENINQDTPFSKELVNLFMPWGGSVRMHKPALLGPDGKETAKYTWIARTSKAAQSKQNLVMAHPMRMDMGNVGPQANTGQFDMVAMVKGKFKSYFADNKPPKEATKKFAKVSTEPSTILAIASPHALASFPGQLGMFNREIVKGIQVNQYFVAGALDIMNGFEELAAARTAKMNKVQPGKIDKWVRNLLTLCQFFLPLIGAAIFGFLRFVRRKRLEQTSFSPATAETEPAPEAA